jgi:arylsulfatase A-like enzyme
MILCGLFVRVATAIPANAADHPPNIVFILADDLGYGALGCYGQQKVQTPNLDRLAAQGIRLTDAYAGCHLCQPSRCVLLTGMHTGHSAIRANNLDQLLLPEDITIGEVLKSAGYVTGCFGKWGQGFEGTTGHANAQGFDEFFGQLTQVHAHFYYPYWLWKNQERYPLAGNEGGKRGEYVPDIVQSEALKFIRANRDRPFFAYVSSIIPHVELVVPGDSEAPYRGKFPQRPILDPRPGYIGSQDGFTTYAGMVSRLDRHVGEILNVLDELGIADNTVVVFTSDNGGQNGGVDLGWTAMTDYFRNNGPFRGYKGSFYEGGMRVPFLIRWPEKIQPGTVSSFPCAFYDVLPTLAEIGGTTAPSGIDGVSLVPTLTGEGAQAEHKALYWEHPVRGGIGRAARQGPWKLVQNGPQAAVELYDLKADIGEKNNVAAEHADLVASLIEFMNGCHAPPRPYPPAGTNPGIKDYVR